MSIQLVVAHAFASYARGDVITDPTAVKKVLGENPHLVVKVSDHPSVQADPAPAAA